uniref:Uncharacterized protein n=1 Tax=Romanomermis culicivorax TaxID=13658 RepID=A0A915JBH3_ROMCU
MKSNIDSLKRSIIIFCVISGKANLQCKKGKTEIEFFVRFRTTLPKRNAGICFKFDDSEYKIINFQGFYCESGEKGRSAPIIHGLATTLTFPCFSSTDMKLNSDCFVMHLTVDFKIIGFEDR